jgi:hypothetical protein
MGADNASSLHSVLGGAKGMGEGGGAGGGAETEAEVAREARESQDRQRTMQLLADENAALRESIRMLQQALQALVRTSLAVS